jgi:hypothetical protein
MSDATLPWIQAESAQQVCRHFTLSEGAQPLLPEKQTPPSAFLDELLDRGLFDDAVPFLAHALPVRAAVWWGCLCLRHVLGKQADSKDNQALFAAVDWVLEPADPYRWKAKAAAQEAGTKSAAGHVALAVAESAAAGNAARHVCAGVHLLARARHGDDKERTLRRLLVIGLGIAAGRHGWEAAAGARPKK